MANGDQEKKKENLISKNEPLFSCPSFAVTPFALLCMYALYVPKRGHRTGCPLFITIYIYSLFKTSQILLDVVVSPSHIIRSAGTTCRRHSGPKSSNPGIVSPSRQESW